MVFFRRRQSNILLLSYFLWLFLPGFVYVSLGGGSGIGIGAVIATVLQISLFIIFRPNFKIYINRVTLIYLCFSGLVVINIISAEYTIIGVRQLGAFMFVVLAVLCAALIVGELKYLSASELRFFFEKLIIIIIAWTLFFYFLPFAFLNYDSFSKSMFPYAEPSHYILSLGFIMFIAGAVVSFKYKVASLSLLFFVGIMMPSMIALALCLLYLIHFGGLHKVKVFFVFLLILGGGGIYIVLGWDFFTDKSGYYIDRIDFSSSANNLTALVYIQGFSLIVSNLVDYPLGLGLQNIGKEPPIDISLKIYHLAGEFKNRTDGGFLASKFISEFGFLGLGFVVVYLIHWFKVLFRMLFKRDDYDEVQLISMAGYLVFIVELFIRGTGYLSFGVLILFIYLINIDKKKLFELSN